MMFEPETLVVVDSVFVDVDCTNPDEENIGEVDSYKSDSLSFRVLLCIDGEGGIRYGIGSNAKVADITKGNCIFIPADSVSMRIYGRLQLLDICG